MKLHLTVLIALFIALFSSAAIAQDAGTVTDGGQVVTVTKTDVASTPAAETAPSDVAAQPKMVGAASSEDDAKQAFDDVMTGKNYARALASLLLIGIVLFVRRSGLAGLKYIPASVKGFLATDRGGVALTLALSFLGALGHAWLTSSTMFSFNLIEAAAMVAVGAIGGYAGLKRLVWPKA